MYNNPVGDGGQIKNQILGMSLLHQRTIDFGRELINDNFWPASIQQYAGISNERKAMISYNYNALFALIESMKSEYVRLSSKEDYHWIIALAYSAKEAHHMFATNDRIQAGLIRDNAMAYVSSWIQKQQGKTIIWSHNVHIAKSEFTMSMFPGIRIKGMGNLL